MESESNPTSPSAPGRHVSDTWIVETTSATFERDVIDASRQRPVIVDFWASWCQPCRLLGPLLEAAAKRYAGRFVLVKANTEMVPDIAASFGVQSIPAVYALYDGQVVDGFVGLLSEAQLDAWLSRIVATADLATAQRLEASDPEAAERIYTACQEDEAARAPATIGLARVALQRGDVERARQLLAELEKRGFLEPEAEKIRAALDLHSKSSVDVDALRARMEADPGNLMLAIDYAEALAAHQQFEPALQKLLDVVAQDKGAARDRAREKMIEIFRVLPEDSELTSTYRRQLASLLY